MIITFTYGDPNPATRDAIAQSLRLVLQRYNATLYADNFTGLGSWTDDDGTTYTEHSGVIVAEIPNSTTPLTDLADLRHTVAEIAITFGQDAIGFIRSTSTNTLVTAHDTRH